MSSWDSYETSGAAAPDDWSEITIGHTLQGQTDSYYVQDWLGEGGFGRVAKCQALSRKQTVAVKMLKDHTESMEAEISMLEKVRLLDPERVNLVHFVECFQFMGVNCLALEMLDVDLYTFMSRRCFVPLQMSEIRPIAQQLLVALDALKGAGILHCDIKPDNVMFTNLEEQSLRIKLIDFGEAMSICEAQPGMDIQALGYRAPEISLGLPFTEAVDAWGVGCLLAYLYLADNLFPVHCEYQLMKRTVELLGKPADHLLQKGKYSDYFFHEVLTTEGTHWRLLVLLQLCFVMCLIFMCWFS
uniref:Protein kinase domain-containing protein n=1 Tax=Knipowitschia caucasica TaxID=637954 RepID=A0AAV2JYG8_KNICA